MSIFLTILLLITSTQASSWRKVLEEDQVSVFAKKVVKGSIPFKAQGVIEASAKDVSRILMDYKNKHLWSPKLKSVKMHKKQNDEYIFSEYYKTPWPAYDREFLLRGEVNVASDGSYIFTAKSIRDKSLEDGDHIQANIKNLYLELKPIGNNKSQIMFEFYGDFQGWLPIWLTNLIQKKWPLRFIQGLRRRVHGVKSV